MRKSIVCLCLLIVLVSCQSNKKAPLQIEEVSLGIAQVNVGPQWLSEWGLFKGELNQLEPAQGVFPYDINSPLFSDYALKSRFIKLPEGGVMEYEQDEVFEFPEGTTLVKNFYYSSTESDKEEKNLIETRLLTRKSQNQWEALTYVWNDDQTDAELEIAGRSVPVDFLDSNGDLRRISYEVPSLNQCKSCHDFNGNMKPIGPSARQLNKELVHGNQLVLWTEQGSIAGLPNLDDIPRLARWSESQGQLLGDRARAWLEINCAHCHRKEGPAKNTGLYLLASEKQPYIYGIHKPPVAAGRGSGNMRYSIVPGYPEKSILFHRIQSLDPGVMMPEVGRTVNHIEGIALIERWIEGLPNPG